MYLLKNQTVLQQYSYTWYTRKMKRSSANSLHDNVSWVAGGMGEHSISRCKKEDLVMDFVDLEHAYFVNHFVVDHFTFQKGMKQLSQKSPRLV